MTREDILQAIGTVEESRLARCEKNRVPSMVIHEEDSNMKNGKYSNTRRSAGVKRIWLIAAVIALATVLMGSAIAALVAMKTGDVKVMTENGEIHEGEKVEFEEVHDVFIELGSWYPQEIPEGYTMTFVSDGAPYQNQNIIYKNDEGNDIWYWIYIADPASDAEVYDIVSKTEVKINGEDGILYEQLGGSQTLVWVNEEQGFGFKLTASDIEIDLIAMAESTAEGEPLTPSRAEETKQAISELGDFSPAYLPEGFEEQGVQASPLSDGGGWYSYVRKWYVNKAENTQIYFTYETYAIMTEEGYTDDAKTICAFQIPGCDILKGIIVGDEIEINGMYGLATDNRIVWADPETHVYYYLYSEDVIGIELLKVAQSIVINP
jgi:hypothetical protein